ncbi:MAG TPA: WxcM-like domain-containing protein [Rubrivivax sp.]|nr:WxcM-like domain-containing protein [Rubrivivax sp.]
MSARDLPVEALQPARNVPATTAVDAHAHLEAGVVLGERCVVRSGAYLASGTVLGDGVYVGPNVAFSDAENGVAAAVIETGAHIGANAVIAAGVTVARHARVRPGSVVLRSVPTGAIVEGNPAAIVGYVNAAPPALASRRRAVDDRETRIVATCVKGVTVHNMPVIMDLRGDLTVGEFQRDVPFQPKRYFVVFGVPGREVRGEHAHYRCHQFLVCVRGQFSVVADDGTQRVEVVLDAPNRGLYLPPMTWGIQYKHTPDAVMMVFASDYYDASDYIRNHDEFLTALAAVKATA